MTHLLDSSALLALYFQEPGWDRVANLLNDERSTTGLSVLTTMEFWSRLRAVGAESAFQPAWSKIVDTILDQRPVTMPVVMEALRLRQAASARLPTVDALIAATAAVHGAVLVHRDPHFAAIPTELLKQEALPST